MPAKQMIVRILPLFLLTATLGIDAQAQWRVIDSYDKWGEKIEGEQIAVSEDTRSVNGIGKRVYLRVFGTSMYCSSRVYMTGGTPMNLFLVSGFLKLPMKVNGIEQRAHGYVGDSRLPVMLLKSGFFDRYDNYSESIDNARVEQVVKWMAQASTFKIILPTREYFNLVYEFDMTGAREAIQTVCPSLF